MMQCRSEEIAQLKLFHQERNKFVNRILPGILNFELGKIRPDRVRVAHHKEVGFHSQKICRVTRVSLTRRGDSIRRPTIRVKRGFLKIETTSLLVSNFLSTDRTADQHIANPELLDFGYHNFPIEFLGGLGQNFMTQDHLDPSCNQLVSED